jgi:hypothetical protein
MCAWLKQIEKSASLCYWCYDAAAVNFIIIVNDSKITEAPVATTMQMRQFLGYKVEMLLLTEWERGVVDVVVAETVKLSSSSSSSSP